MRYPLLILSLCVTLLQADRPNFIFFITDDISPEDIGPYGNHLVHTPNLDQLAAQGLVFERAYLTASSCSPSRNSIITGRFPHNTGAPELHTRLDDSQRTFVQILQDAGYYTVLSGKNHMHPDTQRLGFDVANTSGPSGSENWLEILRERPAEQPFFFWFASNDAHRDWQFTEHAPIYDPDEIDVPPYMYDGPDTRQDLADYFHEVSRTDYYMGVLVRELRRQGILEDTYIIYCADNGRPFSRSKTRLYDSGIRTPLIISRPGEVTVGRTASIVSAIDYAPTFLELAGLDIPQSVQGVSFSPILQNPHAVVREVAFAEQNWHVYQQHQRMVRFDQWLYIRNAWPHLQALSVESDDTRFPEAQELWAAYRRGVLRPEQHDVMLQPRPAEEFYDTTVDPHQLYNLAGDPRYAAEMQKARQLLDEWTSQTGDTIPQNPSTDRGRRSQQDFSRGEMPGQATHATSINHSGPIRLDSQLN